MKLKHALIASGLLAMSVLSASGAYAKLRVMTTFTVLQDITQNIAGDLAEVESLTAIGAEIHEYEPTSRDLVRLNRSDLIITNGMNLEKWFERFYSKSSKKIPTVVATTNIAPSYIVGGPYNGKANPHSWMSIKNSYIYVENIKNALIKYDPKNKAGYEANAKAYLAKIKVVDEHVTKFLAQNNLKNAWLITSESAFSYLARDIGLRYDSIWPVNAEQTGTPQQIKRIVELIKKEKIPVVFSGSTMDPKPMQAVMRETGAKWGGYIYVDTLSDKNGPVPTYLAMLEKTVYQIVDGYKSVIKK